MVTGVYFHHKSIVCPAVTVTVAMEPDIYVDALPVEFIEYDTLYPAGWDEETVYVFAVMMPDV